jgi:hypothetical protein
MLPTLLAPVLHAGAFSLGACVAGKPQAVPRILIVAWLSPSKRSGRGAARHREAARGHPGAWSRPAVFCARLSNGSLPLGDARHFLCEEADLTYIQLGATGWHPHPPTPCRPARQA